MESILRFLKGVPLRVYAFLVGLAWILSIFLRNPRAKEAQAKAEADLRKLHSRAEAAKEAVAKAQEAPSPEANAEAQDRLHDLGDGLLGRASGAGSGRVRK